MHEQLVTIQPSGVGIKGRSYIYAPAGKAGEYAPLAANPCGGCGRRCAYCYVPRVLHIQREEFDTCATPRENFLDHLTKDARKYKAAVIRQQVMLSFTTDVYNPFDTSLTRPTLETWPTTDWVFAYSPRVVRGLWRTLTSTA